MARPLFSVAIPTRERARTLRFALASCLGQPFPDFEVVVCDNGSTPATRQVVDEFADRRIRYVRAPRPLAMCDNWELAVSHAEGEYVTVLGDDDALLGHGLAELDKLVGRLRTPVIRWSPAFYTWPDITLSGEADYLRVPLGRRLATVESQPLVQSVIRFQTAYAALPTLYSSMVHRSLLDRARKRTGRLFCNRYPDVYSGFVIAHLAGRFASVEAPMTIAGVSGGSYGVGMLFQRDHSPRAADARALDAESGLANHAWVPDLPVFPEMPVADSFLAARERLFPDDGSLTLDRRQLAEHYLRRAPRDSAEAAAWVSAIRSALPDDGATRAWFESLLDAGVLGTVPQVRLRNERLAWDGECLHLSADTFGVADVGGAAALCEKLLGYGAYGIPYTETGSGAAAEWPRRPSWRARLRARLGRLSRRLARYRRPHRL